MVEHESHQNCAINEMPVSPYDIKFTLIDIFPDIFSIFLVNYFLIKYKLGTECQKDK